MRLRKVLIRLIRFYQRILSPDHSVWGQARYPYGYCRFYPSCSEYARLTWQHHTLLRGTPKILWRLFRCNPFHRGGIDHPRVSRYNPQQ